jgi:ATP-dependent Clp protease ATP-binding subunit ClpC
MFERFSDDARSAVFLGVEEAELLHHDWVGTEHLVLGLIRERGEAAEAMKLMNIWLEPARAQVANMIVKRDIPPGGGRQFTPRVKRVLSLALREALRLNHDGIATKWIHIGPEHILLGLIREGEGGGIDVLRRLGADLYQLRHKVLFLMGHAEGEAPTDDPAESLVRTATERARRAREVSERLAAAVGDPSVTADDIFFGHFIREERMASLERALKRFEDEQQLKSRRLPGSSEGPA